MRIIRCNNDIAEGLEALMKIDARLVPVAERAGAVPLRLRPAGFDGLANMVVSQMVSKASAAALWRRLTGMAGSPLRAEALLALSDEELRAAGLSRAKAATLRRVAEAICSGALNLETICAHSWSEAQAQLTAIKGIGGWTADVYLMFCAGHPDIFPVGDIALQNAVAHAFGHEERLKGCQLLEFTDIWAPWRSVAARLFWAYYSREMRRSTDPLL